MATPSLTPDKSNRAVIAFADGRRMRGYIYDFSAIKDSFRLSPEEEPLQNKGTEVKMKDLKAVFFVLCVIFTAIANIRSRTLSKASATEGAWK